MADLDFVIVGSGFGGSVSALRLAEKGYKVVVLEKGRRWAAKDFPKNNWDLRNWMWLPELGLRGFFKMTFLRHVTVMHGVGVGGGSLVYANTLPTPKDEFFAAKSWAHLEDWKRALEPHYTTARQMLGSATNPRLHRGDQILKEIADDIGRAGHHHPTDVAVYFGEPGVNVPDPYFAGKGPERTGCTHCGSCMTGCRVGAKNTLDRNYLYLAEQLGVEVRPDTEVTGVRPIDGGYRVEFGGGALETKQVVFAGGVMGTLPLLLEMKEDPAGLPKLSDRLGDLIRTNSEALIGVLSPDSNADFSSGVAITSILDTDDHSHIEPVRYGPGSGFFRMLVLPHAKGSNPITRIFSALGSLAAAPLHHARAYLAKDFSKQSQILLYMRTLEGTLSFRLGRGVRTGMTRGLVSQLDDPAQAPQASIPEASDLADRFAKKAGGVVLSMSTETLLGVPSTAHILGGCCMGTDPSEGVIDASHRVWGYPGLYVIDGSAMSANPGVNPSLTITALAELAMSKIPARPGV